MNIGDKVRLLRHNEEGIITRFVDDKIAEVTIRGDFVIPVLRKELAVINKAEATVWGNEAKPTPAEKQVFGTRGIYLAFTKQASGTVQAAVINNTDYTLPLTLGMEIQGKYKGIFTGSIKPREAAYPANLEKIDFAAAPLFVLQAFKHKDEQHTLEAPFLKRLRLKPDLLTTAAVALPVINRQGWQVQFDSEDKAAPTPPPAAKAATPKPVVVDVAALKDALNNKTQVIDTAKGTAMGTATEVDLHIEKLTPQHKQMDSAAILNLQLETFEKHLDKALANGLKEITFIHGVGSGLLKNEISRRLAKNRFVAYYKEARKEKFGYGATLVALA